MAVTEPSDSFARAMTAVQEDYRRAMLLELSRPMWGEASKFVLDSRRGIYRPLAHRPSNWPEVILFPRIHRMVTELHQARSWMRGMWRDRAVAAWDVLHHGLPEEDDW